MEISRYVFHRLFPLSLPEDKGSVEQGYLNLICLSMSVDGVVTAEELTDAVHLVEQLYDFEEYEGEREEIELIEQALEHVDHMGPARTVELIAEQIPGRDERELALKMAMYIHDADQKVSPIEGALIQWLAEEFDIAPERIGELADELDEEVARHRAERDGEPDPEQLPQTPANNPFLAHQQLPRFAEAEPAQLGPAVDTLLPKLEVELTRLEQLEEASCGGLIEPLERLNARLGFTWSLASHLLNVQNSDALRQAYQQVQPRLVNFSVKIGQSRPIYEHLLTLQQGDQLDEAQQRIVASLVRQAEHSGVGLDGEARERFNAIQTRMAQLSTEFSNHVLDATKAFELVLTEPEDIEGLEPSFLRLAAQSARQAGHEEATAEGGPWRVTLEGPSVKPFLRTAPAATCASRSTGPT